MVFLVAAILWIVVVVAAVCVGVRILLKLRARRRRVNQLIALTRAPLLLLAGRRR